MKRIVFIIIGVLVILFGIANMCMNIDALMNYELESKNVWITSEVYEKGQDSIYSSYVTYDDHNGEQGILYTDSLSKGDMVTVYRNKNSYDKSDSTNGWILSSSGTIGKSILALIIDSILIIIGSIVLYKNVKNKNIKDKI